MQLTTVVFGISSFSWALVVITDTATLSLPKSANCGDQAEMMCTSISCNRGYSFTRGSLTIYNFGGPLPGTDPARYSATVLSNTQVQLTIINIQLSDVGTYACSCGFDTSSAVQTLQYECSASTSSVEISSAKKLSITVDKLYPQPSGIVTALTSSISQLPGTYTCGSSLTFASHYKCTWMSAASLPDGSHEFAITVTTRTQVAVVTGSFRIVTATSPTISNVVLISNNRLVVLGVQDTPLTIQCVSSGGIPAPSLAWYRYNTSTSPLAQSNTSNSIHESDGTYTVTLIHRFSPGRRDDMMPFLCRVFYPSATTGATPDPSPTSAFLYLDLKPEVTKVSQTGDAIFGGSINLRCTSINGRPAPSITWSYRAQLYTPTTTLSFDTTTETYTVVSVLQMPVSAVDNGQTATCRVSHTTLSVPLNATINVDVKFGPAPDTTIAGNKTIPATGTDQIGLNCTSGSSNPASNITWYNGSDVIPNNEGYTRWPGNNNGVISSNILTITPTRYMDGDRVTCRSDNGYGSDSAYVDLDVLYSCRIQTLLNVTAIEGEPKVTLTCSASSNPPATFRWYKGNIVLASGMGTYTDNSLSYKILRADRTDAGIYRCQAVNNVGNPDSKDVYLIVEYPPTVTVSTVTSPPFTVTCTAEGYPNSYTYQDWVQIWPGYGPVATIPFIGTLTLTGATYELSGVYVCGASNGVAVYDTDVMFVKGNATVRIKASPVLTDPSPDGKIVLVAGRLGHDATIEIKYWSNVDGSVVGCYKHVGSSRSSSTSCSVTETDTTVILPVHNHMVRELGTLAIIKIHISSEEDMTAYDVVVSNSVHGESILGIVLVQQGPPEAPTLIGNFSITTGHVILTVLPGFHGGYNQTLVVQISTDLITWINKTSVYIGLDIRPIDAVLVSLKENTLHHVRMFAYNTEGVSNNFSTIMNFTTAKDFAVLATSTATVAGSVVGGIVVMAVIGLVIFLYRRHEGLIKLKQNKLKLSDNVPMTDSRNIYESAVPARDSAHVYSQLHQPEVISADQHRLNNSGLYESPNSLTSSEHVYSVLSAPAKENMYANLRV